MIGWRSDTVITFQTTAHIVPRKKANHTTMAEEASPVTTSWPIITRMDTNRLVPDPSRSEIFEVTIEPSTPPAAPAVISSPNCEALRPRISCAKKT